MTADELPALKLLDAAARLAGLLAPHDGKGFDKTVDCNSVLAIEQALAMWPSTLTEDYKFHRLPAPTSRHAYLGHYDTYSNDVVASTWNRYRCLRMLTNELLIQHRPPECQAEGEGGGGSGFAIVQRPTLSTTHQLAEDICYSMAYFLRGPATSARDVAVDDEIVTVYGSTALGPLLFWVDQRLIPAHVREWARGQIDMVKRATKIDDDILGGMGRSAPASKTCG